MTVSWSPRNSPLEQRPNQEKGKLSGIRGNNNQREEGHDPSPDIFALRALLLRVMTAMRVVRM